MRNLQAARPARRGFTLLESLIVVAVVVLLASAAIPMASKAFSNAARKATRDELVQIGAAMQDYFRDTGSAPASIADIERGSEAAGRAGPYLLRASVDTQAAVPDFTTDAWSRDYRLKLSGDVLSITSAGPDAVLDTADDLRILVDFTPIRREQTLEELAAIHQAIARHDGRPGSSEPLPGEWSQALAQLVAGGFLPAAAPYRADAWGNPYEGVRDAASRLVRVVSTSIASPAAPAQSAR